MGELYGNVPENSVWPVEIFLLKVSKVITYEDPYSIQSKEENTHDKQIQLQKQPAYGYMKPLQVFSMKNSK